MVLRTVYSAKYNSIRTMDKTKSQSQNEIIESTITASHCTIPNSDSEMKVETAAELIAIKHFITDEEQPRRLRLYSSRRVLV